MKTGWNIATVVETVHDERGPVLRITSTRRLGPGDDGAILGQRVDYLVDATHISEVRARQRAALVADEGSDHRLHGSWGPFSLVEIEAINTRDMDSWWRVWGPVVWNLVIATATVTAIAAIHQSWP